MNYILTEPTITTDVATEPVDLATAKAWLAVSFSDDDTIIGELITAARIYLERYTSRSFAPKTLTALMEIGDTELFELPYGPVTAITSVKRKNAFDTDDTLVADEDYQVVGSLIRMQTPGTYEYEYEAGYETLPEDLVKDMERVIAFYYQNRGIRFEAGKNNAGYPFPEILAANRYVNTTV